ncbi:LCP family protein [Holdemanella porci]|uniref:LCP family protein n=1 Tax=Holdemanella porci TaxID=2652276 RepID=UPI003F8EF98F
MAIEEKRKPIILTIFFIILSLIMVVFASGIIYQIIKLQVLPDKLVVPIILIIVLFTAIMLVLLNFFTHGIATRIIYTFLIIAVSVVYGFGNFYLYSTSKTLTKVTTQTGIVKNTVSVIALSSSSMSDVSDLNNAKVGSLKTIGKEGTQKSLKDIKKKNVSVNNKKYDNVPGLIKALYDGDVDAVILNEAYRSNVLELEGYNAFNDETKVIHQTVFYTNDTNDALAVSDITTTPFNILISGNDSFGKLDEVSRSDVDMIVTVNPVTSTVLMTSIPRDSYVQEYCEDYACNYGANDKLTHTGIYGVDTTRDTIEQLLDIDINYTYRVNFTSMIDIVDALGGVDIDVDEGMAVSKFYSDSTLEGVHEGTNHLNGKRALAYSRERKAYLDGDSQRARNQQQVLQAMVKKATSPELLKNYSSILNAISGAFDTNMTSDEITSFIKYQIQAMPGWKFEQYVLKGYSDMQVSAELGSAVSVIMLYQDSIRVASEKIQAVLDGKSSDIIETEEDVPAGTLSEEEIEAQIQAGLMTELPEEGMEEYYQTND